MNLLYDIGKVDIFMNLKILLIIIICINLISSGIKLYKIIDNYNYINRDLSILENLKTLSDGEFLDWSEEYLFKKGFNNFQKLGKNISIAYKGSEKYLVVFSNDEFILESSEAKYYIGYCIFKDCSNLIVVSISNIDRSFYNVLDESDIGYIIFDKNEFNKSYREFIEEEYSLEM